MTLHLFSPKPDKRFSIAPPPKNLLPQTPFRGQSRQHSAKPYCIYNLSINGKENFKKLTSGSRKSLSLVVPIDPWPMP